MDISLKELYEALERASRRAYDALNLLSLDEKKQASEDLAAVSTAVTAGEGQRLKAPADKADSNEVICTVDEKFDVILERGRQFELAHQIVLAYGQVSSSYDPSVAVGGFGELQGLKDLLESPNLAVRERSRRALRLALRRSSNMRGYLKALVDIPVELADDVE